MKKAKHVVVVPWVRGEERDTFLERWGVNKVPNFLLLQRDVLREGCGATKNKGIIRAASDGADVVVVLDGDCYPSEETRTLEDLIEQHVYALEPQPVELIKAVTNPASRGMPYAQRTLNLPVAASMGFWTGVPDYCGARQLAFDGEEMSFQRSPVYATYFPLCGMNVAFRPRVWWPWCQFIDVSRFDDIWMGWLWQKEAYRRKHCFNLAGPMIHHARQSNVWRNLQDEAVHLEANETLWREIALHPSDDYTTLLTLLPAGIGSAVKGACAF